VYSAFGWKAGTQIAVSKVQKRKNYRSVIAKMMQEELLCLSACIFRQFFEG
jgi:hypothetical protein